jgi:alpha-N-arabinofuranosidase
MSLGAGPLTRTYHVSATGKDSGDGSLSKPFKTIQAAANVAMPGDVITVHAGIYRERITPPRGGNSDKERIVYQSANGEKVEIKGSEIMKGWKKLEHDTWVVKIPNGFFGKFNPYSDLIRGDWFSAKGREHHTGAVYLNGNWLMEAARPEEVMKPVDNANPLWYGRAGSDTTTIWAQFSGVDPNLAMVEINVRQTVFYPDKPFISYITIRGFTMQHAATNWAPPTSEQMGLIGTHWSKGWIIEDNCIQYSKCVGIALGKYGDEWNNNNTESAEGYVGTINRALSNGWSKEKIGSHIVRNNTIAYCEQSGVVGSMGCAFSIVEGNTIHDIHVRQLFTGAEMAGIKFHGAVDVQIRNNHIYKTCLGIWLDWMAQGVQVKNNLLNDNELDVFLEVDHGPMLISNNIMLSKTSLLMNSSGAAFVHNIFAGRMDVITYDSRLTPYQKPHSTAVDALHDNPGGDIRFFNNLFVNQGNARQYDRAILPVLFTGNVYTKGTNEQSADELNNRYKDLSDSLKARLRDKVEKNALVKTGFDADAKLIMEKDRAYLEISLDNSWLTEQKRDLVTSTLLGRVIIPDLPFENPDGTPVRVETDYLGMPRNSSNPSPGPFEIGSGGRMKILVWPVKGF